MHAVIHAFNGYCVFIVYFSSLHRYIESILVSNMDSFKRFARGAFDKGGVLALGVVCLVLYRQKYFPSILGPVSYGIFAAGALGFTRYIIMDYDTTNGNGRYQEILNELEERLPEIEEDIKLSEELRESCFRFMSMRECLEAWRRDPSLVEDKITIFEQLLQKTRETSSCATRGSTLETLSDKRTGQGSSLASPREEDITLVHGVEVEDQTDAGNMQHGEQQAQQEDEAEERKEKILQMVPEEIPEAVQQEIPKNVFKEISEEVQEKAFGKVLEDISEEVLNEQLSKKGKRAEEVLKKEAAEEEVAKNMVVEGVAKEVLEVKVAEESLLQEAAKKVIEEAAKVILMGEEAEDVSKEEAAEKILEVDESVEEVAKNVVIEEVDKEVLEVEIAEESLLQEAAKEVIKEASRVMLMGEVAKEVTLSEADPKTLDIEAAKEVTEGKADQKKPVEETAEEVLEDRYLTEDVLEEIFLNVLRREPEQKEEEKKKLHVKLQESLEIEEGKIQKQQQENPEVISVEELLKNKEEEMNIEKV